MATFDCYPPQNVAYGPAKVNYADATAALDDSSIQSRINFLYQRLEVAHATLDRIDNSVPPAPVSPGANQRGALEALNALEGITQHLLDRLGKVATIVGRV